MSNGLRWIVDCGHAWLQVDTSRYPDAELCGTGYGYRDEQFIFLEEDVEAGRFLAINPQIDPYMIAAVNLKANWIGRDTLSRNFDRSNEYETMFVTTTNEKE